MSEEAAGIAREYLVRQDIEARLDSREVLDANGELVGYVLYDMGTSTVGLTPVRDCRSCAWTDAKAVVYATGSCALEYHPSVRLQVQS